MATKESSGSKILDWFTIIKEDDKGKITARCKHCNKDISGSRAVTSNFVSHLKVLHISISYKVQ